MERIAIILPDSEATKLQWTLECLHGVRKTYWITCTNDPDIQHVALDRESFPSHLVCKPCDLNRLLANFQPSLQEITIIATEASPVSSVGSKSSSDGKAVELRSYIDPVKENNDGALHTQLWIDPSEELQEYQHRGAAVDITFSLKELKAFLMFCEGAEADMHMFFENAGKPILLAPRFGLDDSVHADFDATLVLATMLGSQLRETDSEDAWLQAAVNPSPPSHLNRSNSVAEGPLISGQRIQRMSAPIERSVGEGSDHTKIWSEISGSATKSWDNRDVQREATYMQGSNDASEEILIGIQRQPLERSNDKVQNTYVTRQAHMSQSVPLNAKRRDSRGSPQPAERFHIRDLPEPVVQADTNILPIRNPGNWLSTDTDDDEDDDGENICVQSTPPQRRGMF